MNLGELKTEVRDRVGDRKGRFFKDDYLSRVINSAYRDVVAETDAVREHPRSPSTMTMVAGTREVTHSGSRRIVSIARQAEDGSDEEEVQIVAYALRNNPAYQSRFRYGVYVYWSGLFGAWSVGTVDPAGWDQKLNIYSAADVAPLLTEGAKPKEIPDAHHEVIATRAAIIVKTDENREQGELPALYAGQLRYLMDTLTQGTRLGRSRAWR